LKESSDAETLIAVGMWIQICHLWSSRGESTTSKSGFYPGNMKERLARGMKELCIVVLRVGVDG